MYTYRLPGPICGRNDWRRTDENNRSDQEDAQSVLERELRHVRFTANRNMLLHPDADKYDRRATDESILAVQIFDQKKFKKKDQGFLGVVNVRIGSVLDLDVGGDGEYFSNRASLIHAYTTYRDAH
jgi:hypothetical protein